MGKLDGKVAIVTGAGRGLGRGMAITLAGEGAQVVLASRTRSRVEEVAEEIRAAGGEALALAVDVGERDQVYGMVDEAVSAYGGLDILINNAQGFGVPGKPAVMPLMIPLEDSDEREWELMFRTGLYATLWGMKAAFPHLRERGAGKIVNFGSSWGQLGMEGAAAYNANKEGIRALSRTAAREWGKYAINVNVINPIVETNTSSEMRANHPEEYEAGRKLIPLGRYGDALNDAGPLAVFLASSDSDFITGMTFMLDGGFLIYP